MQYYIERELLPSLALFAVSFVFVVLTMLVLFVVGKAATQLAHGVAVRQDARRFSFFDEQKREGGEVKPVPHASPGNLQ